MRVNIEKLEFQKAENAPPMTCNYCGKTTTDVLTCDIELFTEIEKKALLAPAHYTLVVCSRACEKFLKTHPETPRMISYQIERMKQMHLEAEKAPGYAEKLANDKKEFEKIMGDALGEMGIKLGKPIGRDE